MGSKRHRRYIVLVGDLIASRKIAERSAVQQKLRTCLRHLNAKKREGLISPYTVTLGDEFQAVFSAPDRIFRDALSILIALHPVVVRFVFAVGEISTAINTKQAIGMDGPAFHEARETIEGLKKTKALFAVATPHGNSQALMNQSLDLVSHLMRKWPQNRLEILRDLSEHRKVRHIIRDFRVSRQAVYKSIDAGAIRTIVPLLDEIVNSLRKTLEKR